MSMNEVDVLLVGAGAMSATLGALLRELEPSMRIAMVERLDDVALESTSGWNNAGTGHAAYCELNYTPRKLNGSVDCTKAYNINASFEVSLQFWSHLVRSGALPAPETFINPVPHLSFVWGDANITFLRDRFAELSRHPQFAGMEFSDDPAVLKQWIPLVMEGRNPGEKVAATRIMRGTDVNFGSLARSLVGYLQSGPDFELHLGQTVEGLYRMPDGRWRVLLRSTRGFAVREFAARFVFLGGGGGALPLLQKSGIPEAAGYGGFPVSGQWLVCRKPEVVRRHLAKVYGKASIGAPPMSVPHLDTRIIDGEHALLFGPFAGFTTSFLKQGSWLDLLKSVRLDNLLPMIQVGLSNFSLLRYLISEVTQSFDDRINSLRDYFPGVNPDDWELAIAGQRVQIIKNEPGKGGRLEFGTEAVASQDGSLAALLGASPGASVSVKAMLEVLERCFPQQMQSPAWQQSIRHMVPSWGQSLTDDPVLLQQVRQAAMSTLKLDRYEKNPAAPVPAVDLVEA
ncbi:MAG: malate dehydrogenase (quinone) [Thiothrix sp.]|nr:malate dehydrogenase (quinone) [Thiothrix sp.]HPQ96734.1 malate dehydrogenase (quinone) [Thiolinea sp.]